MKSLRDQYSKNTTPILRRNGDYLVAGVNFEGFVVVTTEDAQLPASSTHITKYTS